MQLTVSFLEDAPRSMTKDEFRARLPRKGKPLPLSTLNYWLHGDQKKGVKGWLPYGTIGREVRIERESAKEAILKQSKGGSV
jgi:hypothetical protein